MTDAPILHQTVAIVRRLLMIIGFALFITLGSQSLSQAEDKNAVRGSQDPHAAVTLSSVFAR